MFIPVKTFTFIGVVAISLRLFWFYWVYIPAVIDYYRNPVRRNVAVHWNEVQPPGPDSSKKPNVILILTDDMGFNDITLFGKGHFRGHISTPNIDSIGKDGFTFSRAYSGHATCAPARAALLTGRDATKIGFEFTPASSTGSWILGSMMGNGQLSGVYHGDHAEGLSYANMTLPHSEVTIPEALQTAGYRSLQLGKWHLGLTPESKPIKRGFDETLGFDIIARYLPFGAASASCKFPDFFDRYLWANTRYEVSKDNGPFFAPRGYLTDYLAEEAARAIHVNKANPFFMYMAFTSMHTPLEALQSDYDAVEALETVYGYEKGAPRMTHCQKVYGAMLLGLDRAVGTILSAVDAAGISDDTIVIFTNDNGAPLIFPHMNAPYRGGKANLFEGGIRVPLMIRWPALSKQLGVGVELGTAGTLRSPTAVNAHSGQAHVDIGVEVDAIVSHLDLFPTIMEVAGAGSPGTEPIDGSSLVPLMKAAASRNRVAASTGNPMVDESRDGMATDDNKESTAESGHEALFWRSGHYMALRHGDWKLQVAARPDKKWLYNMKEDPREMINLAENNAYESKLIEMLSLLESENSKHSEPLWPALSETPLLIDKLFHDHYVPGDEYIYWPN